jgi:integrase
VERQRDSRAEGFTPHKTRSSVRTVPLGVRSSSTTSRRMSLRATGRCSPTTPGRALVYTGCKPLCKVPGTSYESHDLRHHAASALIAGGASVKQVQMILGHARLR